MIQLIINNSMKK